MGFGERVRVGDGQLDGRRTGERESGKVRRIDREKAETVNVEGRRDSSDGERWEDRVGGRETSSDPGYDGEG